MIKAIDRFDPGYGYAFATYAVPTIVGELRRRADLSIEDTLDALETGDAYRPAPLDHTSDDDLPSDRERRIIQLRFVDNLSQSQIADRLDLSQVHVSRLLRNSLGLMRQRLTTPTPR